MSKSVVEKRRKILENAGFPAYPNAVIATFMVLWEKNPKKVVAKLGQVLDLGMYMGEVYESDARIAKWGDRISEDRARALLPYLKDLEYTT